MMDHAKRIADKEREDKRIAEMERESAPLFYTIVCLATLVICMGITEYHDTKQEAQRLSDLLAMAANERMTPIGQDAVLECKRTELVAGL